VSFSCQDLEAALLDESPALMAALAAHASTCAACARELREWQQLSALAPELRKGWESPSLWPRIEQGLAGAGAGARLRGWLRWASPAGWRGLVPMAAVALLLVAGAGGVWLSRARAPGGALTADWQNTGDPLLTDQAVDQVESAERQYIAAIERLSKLAGRQVAAPSSPLARSYREKLVLLDATIAELQAGIDSNRLNSNLRRELLAMYREKQQTLRDLMQLSGQVERTGEGP
jgi:hypothetical protein